MFRTVSDKIQPILRQAVLSCYAGDSSAGLRLKELFERLSAISWLKAMLSELDNPERALVVIVKTPSSCAGFRIESLSGEAGLIIRDYGEGVAGLKCICSGALLSGEGIDLLIFVVRREKEAAGRIFRAGGKMDQPVGLEHENAA